MVEFAFVIPVFLLLIMGILELSFVVTDQIHLYGAARDGSRAGAVPAGSSTASRESLAVNAAQTSANGTIGCTSTSSARADPYTYATGAPPRQVTVTVACSYRPVTPLGALMARYGGSFGAINLSSSSAKAIEQ